MKSSIAIASLAVGANALVTRGSDCCFHITTSGGASGELGQLGDGQVRVNDHTLSPSKFCLSNGVITDSEGRPCVVTGKQASFHILNDGFEEPLVANLDTLPSTGETTQFQCDAGSTGTSGFSVSSSGKLEFNGNADFVACATGLNGGSNIYTTESDKVTQCVDVQLMADSTCAAPAPSSVAPVASPSSTPCSPWSTWQSSSMTTSSSMPWGSSPVGSSSASTWTSVVAPMPSGSTSMPVWSSASTAASSSVASMSSSASAAMSSGASATVSTSASTTSGVAAVTSAPPSSAARPTIGYVGTVMAALSMAILYLA
ncbi:hypothetical protein N7539_000893 [Penicillium diatomitis]|uniref:Cell wall mannoprotein PIR1-like C-terminal domain-containing protein n=1 Tax=Penicillium diatomitis TaxID=2819901 RepID=A0A9W9XMN6_9EURO|nr:uncharacterized protein N7539_000893 [Penicillium diatomitis]KAJ5495777.1 hypothetical protein N7539_000893 [Penicillium diatomitis]